MASATGIQQIIVGTGGTKEGVYPLGPPIADSSWCITKAHQALLEITLHPGAHDWQFVPAAGFSFTDSGSGTCH